MQGQCTQLGTKHRPAPDFDACNCGMQENKPTPLIAEDRDQLTWEAATERFLDVASIRPNEWPSRPVKAQNLVFWRLYNTGIGSPSFHSCPALHISLPWMQMNKHWQEGRVCTQPTRRPCHPAMVAVH